MLNQNRAELVKLVSEIVIRWTITPERVSCLLKFTMCCKLAVNYRTSLHSNVGCSKLWDYFDLQMNVEDPNFMEMLMGMTQEFIFLSELDANVTTALGQSLSWATHSRAIPEEMSTLTASTEDYTNILQDNPWAVFTYLVSMTDLVRILGQIKKAQ